MPVIQQQAQPVFIQGTLPAQAARQNTLPPRLVQIQQGATPLPGQVVTTLPAQQVTTLQRPPAKKAEHIPLARCSVLYLGSAVPLETSQGIEAVQGPCRERYPFETDGDVNGIDAWLSVFSSGILLSYVNDKNGNTWFPIQSLYVCTAVKCVINVDGLTGEKNPKFVALDSEESKGSLHPPIFAAIMRRTKGKKVLECHVFIAKSPKASMALVQSCTHAYGHKEGWTEEPPSMVTKPNAPTRLVPAKPVEERDRPVPPEFFETPPPKGFFYTSNKDLVKSYNVFGGSNDRNQGTESEPGDRRQPAAPQAAPQAAPGGPGAPMPQGPYYPTGPASTLGPPGAPVPPQFGPPPPGLMMAPPFGVGMLPPPGFGMPPPGVPIPPPGMFPYQAYPMPPPPPGYFADWDRHEGRPVAVFDERHGSFRPQPLREPEIRTYQQERPPADSRRDRDVYREPPRERVEYREPPRGPPREYREAPPTARGVSSREYKDYREPPPQPRGGDDYYREAPTSRPSRRTRSKSPRKQHGRVKSPSPPRQGYRQDVGRRARTPPVDYERKLYGDQYASRKRYDEYRGGGGGGGQEQDAPSDLILYAPKYRERLPEYRGGGREYGEQQQPSSSRRREGRDFVEYTSQFNPEIVMKGSKDYRENRSSGHRQQQPPPLERSGYVRGGDEDEDPYRYERDLPIRADHQYPRQERGFERSLQEERETIGDAFSDAYRENDFETDSVNIEYGMFRGMGDALGYLP